MPILKTVLDVNALDDDRIFKQFYNVSGAGVSPYTPVQLDTEVNKDGISATQCKSAAAQGALFLGVINNALPVIGVSPFWQMAISGTVIVIAVLLNERGNKRKGRLILRDAALARQKQAVNS
jgi:hypothetical protein